MGTCRCLWGTQPLNLSRWTLLCRYPPKVRVLQAVAQLSELEAQLWDKSDRILSSQASPQFLWPDFPVSSTIKVGVHSEKSPRQVSPKSLRRLQHCKSLWSLTDDYAEGGGAIGLWSFTLSPYISLPSCPVVAAQDNLKAAQMRHREFPDACWMGTEAVPNIGNVK